jgi:hypothetical protein
VLWASKAKTLRQDQALASLFGMVTGIKDITRVKQTVAKSSRTDTSLSLATDMVHRNV